MHVPGPSAQRGPREPNRRRVLEGTDPPVTVAGGFERRLSGSRTVGLTAGFGLTETAPDVSLSLQWRLPF